jgi:hypothetical protein
MLNDFKLAGFVPFPLSLTSGDERTRGKIPAHRGWQTKDYSEFKDPKGFNVGFRLTSEQLILDVDPRNNGDASLDLLCEITGCDLRDAPTTITGSGGHHHYYLKPADLATSKQLRDFPGIEFLSIGNLVVAPGSMHFKSGKHYRTDKGRPHISHIEEAPAELLELLAKPAYVGQTSDDGQIDDKQLARLLAVLDATDFGVGERAKWIRLSASCHSATGAMGEEAWMRWCLSDEDFDNADTMESNQRIWREFKNEMPCKVTIGTLFWYVKQAGGEDIVRQVQYEIRRDKALKEFLDGDDDSEGDEEE